eukprot:10423719-Ditylum_brightwellii.AAC.1
MDKPLEGKSVSVPCGTLVDFVKLKVPAPTDELLYADLPPCIVQESVTGVVEDNELLESFLNHPPLHAMPNPITMLNIQQYQFQDLPLNQLRQQQPDLFPV